MLDNGEVDLEMARADWIGQMVPLMKENGVLDLLMD